YFQSDRTGKKQIWKVPATGGDAVPVQGISGESAPVESPDGRFLYYDKGWPETYGVWRVPTSPKPWSLTVSVRRAAGSSWTMGSISSRSRMKKASLTFDSETSPPALIASWYPSKELSPGVLPSRETGALSCTRC